MTVELRLMPAGNHDGDSGGQTQVDRMTATGHVVLTSQGRRGTGEQLVYYGRDRRVCADRDRRRAAEDDRSRAGNGDRRGFDFP